MKIFGRKKEAGQTQQPQGVDTGKGSSPDYRRMMMTLGGDAKGHALAKLLTSDASNAIKSSNSNPFNLSVMDVMGHWESAESEEDILRLFLNGRTGVGEEEIEGGYRINKMAEDFKMTLTYSDAYKAWTIMGGAGFPPVPSRMDEGRPK